MKTSIACFHVGIIYYIHNPIYKYNRIFSHSCGKIPGEVRSLNPVYNVTVFAFPRPTGVR